MQSNIFTVTRDEGRAFGNAIILPTTQNKSIKNNLEYGFTTANYKDQKNKHLYVNLLMGWVL